MNDAKLVHPDFDQLTAFAQGRLGEAELATLFDHLGDCAECRTKVEAAGDDTFISLLRAADTNPQRAVTLAAGSEAALPGLPTELSRHGRYRVQELLGVGGMGAVYRAEHLLMERPVALKLISHNLTSNPAMIERFRREVKTAAKLKHPNIVMAYDAEQAGDSHFLVMEYVEGQSLARLVSEQGPLPVAQACEYIRQAALGLQHAHERGMVHRDIKPQNLMRTPDGHVKILDFGLARFAMEAAPTGALLAAPEGQTAAGSLTQVGTVMGTPDYIAPEQARDAHTADIRADIYSLGCTLYDLLAGHAPFPEGTVVAKVKAHLERVATPLAELRSDVPPALARVVERMMAKDPAQRYQTPAEVAVALAQVSKPPVPPRPRWWPSVAAAVLLVGGLLAGGVVYTIHRENQTIQIQTNDPHIELVMKRSGEVVLIRDGKSGQTWEYDTLRNQIGLADQAEGLTLSVDKEPFVLRRKGKDVFTVTRIALEATDQQQIQGTWRGVAASVQGLPMPEGVFKTIGPTITFANNKVTWRANPAAEAKDLLGGTLAKFNLEGIFRLDATKSPSTIDLTVLGAGAKTPLGTPAPRALLGIYKLQGDSLELCIAIDPDHADERPSKFASVRGKPIAHLKLQRESAWPGAKSEPGTDPTAPPLAVAPFDAAKAREYQEVWAKHLGVPVEIENAIGMKLRLIPPGRFHMGSSEDEIEPLVTQAHDFHEKNLRSETPRRLVEIPAPFYLGQFELTVAQFRQFALETGYKTTAETNGKGGASLVNGKGESRPEWTWRHPDHALSDNHPVVEIDQRDAEAYCAWLSKKDGRTYVVPDEQHWEFACRAGSTSPWYGRREALGDFAWIINNHEGKTHAVGGKLPNAFGLYDMLGNVEEICRAHDGGVVGRGGMAHHNFLIARCAARRRFKEGDDLYFRRGVRVAIVGALSPRGPAAGQGRADPEPKAPPVAVAPFSAGQAKAHQEAWAKHLGVPVKITNSIGMKLWLIPPGTFLMGENPETVAELVRQIRERPSGQVNEQQVRDIRTEAPQHKETIPAPYYLGAHEVTVGQFRKFVEATSYKTTAENHGEAGWRQAEIAPSADHPVTALSVQDAKEFCAWLSKTDGRAYGLPDEKHWEFACRAGTTSSWYADKWQEVERFAWWAWNAEGTSHAVGGKLPNAFGLYDMLGNVEELCRTPGGGVVGRGGMFHLGPFGIRCAARNQFAEDATHGRRGFRVAIVGDLKPR